MRLSSVQFAVRTLSVAFAVILVVAAAARPQSQERPSSMQSGEMSQREMQMNNVNRVGQGVVDPKEEAAYKVFYKADEPAQKIQLGNDFIQKYPKSPYVEPVDVGLMNVYYAKQDWKNVYAFADGALALKPDDVDVLTAVGWLIPHIYNSSDPDADQQLDKAETYAKHAVQVIPTMPKPANLSDAQFAALKTQKSIQAHSALGLVYFRREDYDDSVKELQQTTENNPNPDQTDLFVLGIDLQSLKRYSEAVDAFNQCAQIAGGMRDRCKQSADEAKKRIAH